MHPVVYDRRALAAYLAAWALLAYVPASLLASPGSGHFLAALLAAGPATLLFGLGTLPLYYLCQALPLRARSAGRVLRVQAAVVVAWSLLWLALLALAALAVDAALGAGLAREVEGRAGALAALGAVLSFAVVVFHYLVLSTRRARASERRAAAASLQAREAQLSTLRAQVHPHFLFNSLNAISALTVADPKLARELCLRLAEFLRGSLALGERATVTLEEEVELARAYLDVERVRLGDRLRVDLQVAPAARQARVPSLLLQPLVENAITHGVATCAEGGTLALAAHTTPALLVVTLTNPFDPQAPRRRSAGVGLANVRRRLVACDAAASLTTRREEGRFTATLVLPAVLAPVHEEAPHGQPAA